MVENAFSTVPQMILDFLQKTKPFDILGFRTLENLSTKFLIDFFPNSSVIARENETQLEFLYVVQKGAIKRSVAKGRREILMEICGEGHSFGALALMQNISVPYTIEAVEDTFCFLLPREDFVTLVSSNSRISEYYLNAFSDEILCSAYRELLTYKVPSKNPDSRLLFNQPLKELIRTTPEIIHEDAPLKNAAAIMARLGLTSLLVKNQVGDFVGIITDQDLRNRVVAVGLDSSAPVSAAMTRLISTISAHKTCFDALLTIIEEQTNHVAIQDETGLIGIMSDRDILLAQGASPLFLFRELSTQRDISILEELAARVPIYVRNLIESGAKTDDIAKTITLFNNKLFRQCVSLVRHELGIEPAEVTVLAMGQHGRSELILDKTLEHALVWEDSSTDATCEAYFSSFSELLWRNLESCGYKIQKRGISATIPIWRQPACKWKSYFDAWISDPSFKVASDAQRSFDLRTVYGSHHLERHIQEYFLGVLDFHPAFLKHLAEEFVILKPPISFFRDLVVEKSGEKKGRLDLRNRGMRPIVYLARLLSLKYKVRETNTSKRMEALKDFGYISETLYKDVMYAYEFQMQLALINQLHQIESGQTPDYYILPATLSDLEKRTLREAFRVLEELPAVVKSHF